MATCFAKEEMPIGAFHEERHVFLLQISVTSLLLQRSLSAASRPVVAATLAAEQDGKGNFAGGGGAVLELRRGCNGALSELCQGYNEARPEL